MALQCKSRFNRKMVFRVTKSQSIYFILHDHPDWGVACGGVGGGGGAGGAIYMRF